MRFRKRRRKKEKKKLHTVTFTLTFRTEMGEERESVEGHLIDPGYIEADRN